MANIREISRNVGKKAVAAGVGIAVTFGSNPAIAAEITQTSRINSDVPCIPGSFFPETPNLGDFIGAPVRIPTNFSEVRPHSLENIPGSTYFYPIYDPSRADAAHQYVGIGPHYGVAYQNLDGNYAADVFTFGNIGELAIKAKNGGRFAISFEHEFINQWQGTFFRDSAGNLVFDPNINMAYWFEGLLPGQQVMAVDPDTGRQLRYDDGNLAIFFAGSDGRLGVAMPKTCNADARVQFVTAILNNPSFPPQSIIVRRGPDVLVVANSLPGGVIKPSISGSW